MKKRERKGKEKGEILKKAFEELIAGKYDSGNDESNIKKSLKI